MTHTCITTSQIAALDADPSRDLDEISKEVLLDVLCCPLTCHPTDKLHVSRIIADIKSSGILTYLPTERSSKDALHAVSLGDYFNVAFDQKSAYCRAYIDMRNAASGNGSTYGKQKRAASNAVDYDQIANKVAAVLGDTAAGNGSPYGKQKRAASDTVDYNQIANKVAAVLGKGNMPQPQASEGVAKQMAEFFDVPGVPNDVFKNGFNNRLNDGIHPTRLPYNGAGQYSSTGTR